MKQKKTKNQADITTNQVDIGYKGNLKITYLSKNNKVLSTKRYHNIGCMPMFMCMGKALIGQYENSLTPQYIRAFQVDPTDIEWEPSTSKSDAILYTNPPRLVSNVLDNTVSIIYTFFFSRYQLVDGGAGVNAIALYSSQYRLNLGNPSAYFLLDPPIPEEGEDTNLIIEWTLTIGNKQGA